MTTMTDECIHGLTEQTCSLCSTREQLGAPRTLRSMISEALDVYSDEDEDLVLRLVFAEAVALPDAVELFLPLLRWQASNLAGYRRRQIESRLDVTPPPSAAASLGASPKAGAPLPTPSLPEATACASPKQLAPQADPSRPEANESARPKTSAPPVAPSSQQEANSRARPTKPAPPAGALSLVPDGVTPAEYARQHQAVLKQGEREWMLNFAKRYAPAEVRIAGWRGRMGEASLDQVRRKMTDMRHQASGIAEGLKHLGRVEEILVITGAKSLDDFIASHQG